MMNSYIIIIFPNDPLTDGPIKGEVEFVNGLSDLLHKTNEVCKKGLEYKVFKVGECIADCTTLEGPDDARP